MSGTAKTKTGSENKNNKAVIILIIVLAVIIIAFVAVVAFLIGRMERDGGSDSDTGRREVAESARLILDEDSAQNVLDEMRKEVEEGMFECSMSTEWTFKDGSSESKDAYVANSANNTHPFYFDVILDGTEEVVYSSPVVPVGSRLTDFKLDKQLEAGTYEAICKYVLLSDEESQEEISTANFVITITVNN